MNFSRRDSSSATLYCSPETGALPGHWDWAVQPPSDAHGPNYRRHPHFPHSRGMESHKAFPLLETSVPHGGVGPVAISPVYGKGTGGTYIDKVEDG